MNINYRRNNIFISYKINKNDKIHGIYKLISLNSGVFYLEVNFINGRIINYYYQDLFMIKRITFKYRIQFIPAMNSIIYNKYNGEDLKKIIQIEKSFDNLNIDHIKLLKDIKSKNINRYKKYQNFKCTIIKLKNGKINGKCRSIYFNTNALGIIDIDILHYYDNEILVDMKYNRNIGVLRSNYFNLFKLKKEIISYPLICSCKSISKSFDPRNVYILKIKLKYRTNYSDVIIKTTN